MYSPPKTNRFLAALPRELDIYQKLLYDPALEGLRPFTVNFLGILKLEGQVDQSNPITANGGIAIIPIDDHKKMSVFRGIDFCIPDSVLDNTVHRLRDCYTSLTRPFLKPNILDVKLGTIR